MVCWRGLMGHWNKCWGCMLTGGPKIGMKCYTICYLLIRKCPNNLWGLPPFNLLYGGKVRWLLDLIRDSWEGDAEAEGEPVTAYVQRFRQELKDMMEMVQSNPRDSPNKRPGMPNILVMPFWSRILGVNTYPCGKNAKLVKGTIWSDRRGNNVHIWKDLTAGSCCHPADACK